MEAHDGVRRAHRIGRDVVAEADVRFLKQQVADLQRLLGKKTQEVEILKDALELVNSKKLPWRGGSSNNGGTR